MNGQDAGFVLATKLNLPDTVHLGVLGIWWLGVWASLAWHSHTNCISVWPLVWPRTLDSS